MDNLLDQIEFETIGPVRRLLKAAVVHPLVNYLPAGLLKGILRLSRSELAAANWGDPGGWRSMVISYNGRCRQWADKLLVAGGTIPMALRNRRRLAGKVLARLIEEAKGDPVQVLCVGAGPGMIVIDAMVQARRAALATLMDLRADAHRYAGDLAKLHGLEGRIRFVTGDARDISKLTDCRPEVVKMIGICEYLSDEEIGQIASALASVMPSGGAILFNSLSKSHGTDRFFRRVFGLHMIHRSPSRLQEIVGRSGFGDFVSIGEPLGVYHVITGRRRGLQAAISGGLEPRCP
jgi:hypothetical protein